MHGPNVWQFISFIRGVMNIDPLYLPNDAPVIFYAFQNAKTIVNPLLRVAGTYDMAVFNLGGDTVINFADDQPGRTYFIDERKRLNIGAFVPGVITSSADNATSQSTLNPEFMKNFTLRDLQNLKTPWGRAYLALAQDFGPPSFGLT